MRRRRLKKRLSGRLPHRKLLGIILLPAVIATYFFNMTAGYIMTAAFAVYVIISFLVKTIHFVKIVANSNITFG